MSGEPITKVFQLKIKTNIEKIKPAIVDGTADFKGEQTRVTENQKIMTQYMTTMQQLLQQRRIEGEVDDDKKKPWWKFW